MTNLGSCHHLTTQCPPAYLPVKTKYSARFLWSTTWKLNNLPETLYLWDDKLLSHAVYPQNLIRSQNLCITRQQSWQGNKHLISTLKYRPISVNFEKLTFFKVYKMYSHSYKKFLICAVHGLAFKVEALWFKCFIVFLENLVLGTFICADNESKIKKIGWRLRFWDTGVAKTTYFLSKSHDLPHKVIREVRQININVLLRATNASFIFLIFTYVKVYLKYFKITK